MSRHPPFLTNMSAPMPLPKKVMLVIRNNWLKVYRRRNCCGNGGKPGC